MSTDATNANPLVVNKFATDDAFDSIAKTSQGWLPRIQLFSSSNNIVKEGKFPLNCYGLVLSKDSVKDLGKEVIVLPLSWRPKALMCIADKVVSRFDPDSKEFQDIVVKSEKPNSFCMYGPEFLVWLYDAEKLATFFMCNKSARREARPLRDLLDAGKTGILSSKFVKTAKYSWQAVSIEEYNGAPQTPFDIAGVIDDINNFNEPPIAQEEKAEEMATPGENDRPR